MFKKALLVLILSLSALFAAEAPKAIAKPATVAVKPTMLVFINPNGRPCQIQLEIMQSKIKEIEKLSTIKLIKTTEPNDRDLFYKYGIRSLPSIIIADSKGLEKHRFAPGIQEANILLEQLNKVK